MKRSTAIRHLVEMSETATERLRLRGSDLGWPLEELWVTGELLSLAENIEVGSVVLVLDVPAEEMPWLALNPSGEWVGHELRLGKRPMGWCYRPLALPPWNHEHRRVVRFWSARDGLDSTVIDALGSRHLERLTVVEPSREALAEQLDHELTQCRSHVRVVVDNYWDHDWRRRHKAFDEGPEDHLWRSATAVADIMDALDELQR